MKVCPCEKREIYIYIETSATIAHFVLHVLKQREDVARGQRIHVVRTLEALVP
jgi:hypothetical protein